MRISRRQTACRGEDERRNGESMAAESFGIASKSLELFIPRKETVPLERGTEGHDADVAAAQEFEKRLLRPALVGQHALEAGAEIGVGSAPPLGDFRRGRHR